jgi:hypothetical protein
LEHLKAAGNPSQKIVEIMRKSACDCLRDKPPGRCEFLKPALYESHDIALPQRAAAPCRPDNTGENPLSVQIQPRHGIERMAREVKIWVLL